MYPNKIKMEEKQLRDMLSQGFIVDNQLELMRKQGGSIYGRYVVAHVQRTVWNQFENEDKNDFPLISPCSHNHQVLRIKSTYNRHDIDVVEINIGRANNNDDCIILYQPSSFYKLLTERKEQIIGTFYTSRSCGNIQITNKGTIVCSSGPIITKIITNASKANWDTFTIPTWFSSIVLSPLRWWYKLIIPDYVLSSAYYGHKYERYDDRVIIDVICQIVKKYSENANDLVDDVEFDHFIALPERDYKDVITYSFMTGMKLNYPHASTTGQRQLPDRMTSNPSDIYLMQSKYLSSLFKHETREPYEKWKDKGEKIVWSYTSPVYITKNSSGYSTSLPIDEFYHGGDFVGITSTGNVVHIKGNLNTTHRLLDDQITLYEITTDNSAIPKWFTEIIATSLFHLCDAALQPVEECISTSPGAMFCIIERRDHINIVISILCEMIYQYRLKTTHRENFTNGNPKMKDAKTNSISIFIVIAVYITMVFLVYYIVVKYVVPKLLKFHKAHNKKTRW